MDLGLDGGFVDPVLQSQGIFRAILAAMAHPGTVQELPASASGQSHLTAELASVLLTLSDQDTLLWLADPLRNAAGVERFVAFHTGAPVVDEPGRAMFAYAGSAADLPRLDRFNAGTQEYPDRSTTIVLRVDALSGGDELRLTGPGIKDHGHISPIGLPEDFVAQWAANRELFPRGIDLLLMADGSVMGLPRSTRIAEGH
ncbi:MAG TPA: phosphonate C-P lyase system protein PhnH [Devosia sp.]|jgi:alpha-D-ribose 1-methylphosphonate 5-triphosphate synthase subunit PhnH|nr:phosphonate C-P lyase system protein PhnH [Devosia sp.]